MDKKTTGIIATVAAVLLCGCPAMCLCPIAIYTATGNMPWTTDINGVTSGGYLPSWVGFVGLCAAVLLVAVPVVVGVVLLRKKPEAPVVIDEPIPPAT